MGPILPGNILKPGAHPKHLNKDKDNNDEKKIEEKKDDKKEESKMDNNNKKSDKKEDPKPKTEGESHSV